MATNSLSNQIQPSETFYAGSEILRFGVSQMPASTRIYIYCNGVNITDFCGPADVSGAKVGDPIVTNQLGTAAGWLYIPSGDGKYKFLIGEIVLTFSDSPDGVETSKYIAETILYNHGLNTVDTEKGGTIALRTTEKIKTSPLGNTLEVNTTQLRLDPLAQTFFVDPIKYPLGIYLTGVSLFFYEKDPVYPVAVELRQVINGVPSTNEVLSGSFALLNSSEVGTYDSVSGKVAVTNFTFPHIQYLRPGEWAFCVLTKSARYTLLSSKITDPAQLTAAQKDWQIVNNFVNVASGNYSAYQDPNSQASNLIKQPFAGRLFRAQNTGNWVGDTNEDLAFILRKAKFATGSVTIEAVSLESENTIEYNRLRLLSTAIEFGDTASVKYSLQTTSAGAREKSEYQEIQPGNNAELDGRKEISKAGDSKILIEITSKSSDISPMIDRQLLAAQVFKEYVTDYTAEISASELKSSGGLAKARYISKPVTLADGFDSTGLEVKLDVCRQTGTDIEVFCRVLSRNDKSVSNGIYDRPWEKMPLVSPAEKTFSGTDSTLFFSETYRLLEPELAYIVNTADGGKYEDFAYYQIKVVFYSNNPIYQSRLRSLSAISVI